MLLSASSGPKAAPITKAAIPRPATQATGRHRRDGSAPSGNRSRRNVTSNPMLGIQLHPANQATSSAPGRGDTPVEYSAKVLPAMFDAWSSAKAMNSHPMAFRG